MTTLVTIRTLLLTAFITAAAQLAVTTLPSPPAAVAADLSVLEKSAGKGDAEAQFSLAKSYRAKGEEVKAIDWFQKAASQGHVDAQYEFGTALAGENPEAMYLMGLMYRDGKGVDKDRNQAVDWLKKAAKAGNRKAADVLAGQFDIRIDLPKAQKTAAAPERSVGKESADFNEIKKRAFSGDAEAKFELAKRYRDGNGTEKSEPLALKWFQRAARQGHVEAQFAFAEALKKENPEALYLMGLMYRTGDGVEKDPGLALDWLKKAADKGHPEAMYTIGTVYRTGDGVAANPALAAKWLKKAANAGYQEAKTDLALLEAEKAGPDELIRLGRRFKTGKKGTTKDVARAFNLYLMAAKKGSVKAMLRTAQMLAAGVGTAASIPRARKWYRRAAEKGDPSGQYLLADAMLKGKADRKARNQALVWLKKSAAANHTPAIARLGTIYLKGDGVKRDSAEGLRYLTLAAEAGVKGMAARVALMYERGIGTSKSAQKARFWYSKAANEGNPASAARLAHYLKNGIGGKKDTARAAGWYRVAVKNGNREAAYQLGLMYSEGLGVKKSSREAKKLFALAAGKGSTDSLYRLAILAFKDGNHRDAASKLTRAAAKGHPMAAYLAGYLFETGIGVKRDIKKARGYYSRAAKSGNLYGAEALAAIGR